jgi:hypothetical protein
LLVVVAALVAFYVTTAQDMRTVVTAAGLFGIGHGVHTAGKHLSRRG